MAKRRSSRSGGGEPGRTRRRARPPARSVPTKPEAAEAPAQERAPNRAAWLGPFSEEELAALEAGWGFIE